MAVRTAPRDIRSAGKLEVTLWGAWGRALGSQPEPGGAGALTSGPLPPTPACVMSGPPGKAEELVHGEGGRGQCGGAARADDGSGERCPVT